MKKTFTRALAILLVIVFAIPSAFFIAPKRTSAAGVSCIGGLLGGIVGGVASKATSVPVADAPTQQGTAQTAGTTYGSCFYEVIVVPLARAAIRVVLQSMTKSVINFINGTTSGQPSFVQDLSTHLQRIGDSAAISFMSQLRQSVFKSPYGTAIALALNAAYYKQTSRAGFFAAYASTLHLFSPNVNRFLAGDWSQGGAAAWFALQQPNNNPYMVYQAAQSQLSSGVEQGQTNVRQDLIQSGGFLSFCPQDTTTNTTASSIGANLQVQCTNADGTPAKAQTPGSIINGYAQKAVVSSGFDQLISANDIDNSLSQIMTALIMNAFSGSGIFGVSSKSSGGGRALYNQLDNYTASSTNLSNTVAATAQEKLAQIDSYGSAWDTIKVSADTASTSVQVLIKFCTDQKETASATLKQLQNPDPANETNPDIDTGAEQARLTSIINSSTQQINVAQNVFTKSIVPVFTEASGASTTIKTIKALAAKIGVAAPAGISTTSAIVLNSDTQALMSSPPSAIDIQSAQQNAQAEGNASASPVNSLNVSGGSLVDKMNLLNKNAAVIKAAGCTVPPPPSNSTPGSSSDNGSSADSLFTPGPNNPNVNINPLKNPATNPGALICGILGC